MTLEKAIEKITEKWGDIPKANQWSIKDKRGIAVLGDLQACWVFCSDTAESYEVDEEHIGVTEGGKIAWAYASGCSCWDGNFKVERLEPATMKTFTFNHGDAVSEKWEKAIIEFAEKL